VKDWLKELVFTIDPRTQRSRFLPFFLQANILISLLDEQSSLEYVRRALCMTIVRPSEFIRSRYNDYVLDDALESIIGRSDVSLARGLLFAK
jgi:hypothetical protein